MKRRHRRAKRPKGSVPVPGGGYATEHHAATPNGKGIYLRAIHNDPLDVEKLARVFLWAADEQITANRKEP